MKINTESYQKLALIILDFRKVKSPLEVIHQNEISYLSRMGLDICLVEIVKSPTSDSDWIPFGLSNELDTKYVKFITQREFEYEGELIKESGYYSIEIAYQRKGVLPSFAKRYGCDDFLFSMRELFELKQHIDKKHMDSFQINFIDEFIEGQTIIDISC